MNGESETIHQKDFAIVIKNTSRVKLFTPFGRRESRREAIILIENNEQQKEDLFNDENRFIRIYECILPAR